MATKAGTWRKWQDGAKGRTREVQPHTAQKLIKLKLLYREDNTFAALVDMYRNIDLTVETAAYFFAYRDYKEGGGEQEFSAHTLGYDHRELEFLRGRGVRMYP